MRIPSLPEIQAFILKYERVISPVTLLVGFTIDYVTLRRIDLLPSTLIICAYLSVLGLSIFFLHLAENGLVRKRYADAIKPFAPMALQYSIGALFSAFLIFYSTAGSLAKSWPFVLFLILVAVGTEFFRRYHERLIFQASVFYLAVFSFFIFFMPLLLNEMGSAVFLLSGVVSAAVFGIFLALLFATGRRRVRVSVKHIAISAIAIYASMNMLYFTNVLPPIPLSLKEIGIYHGVTSTSDGYQVLKEPTPWYQRFMGGDMFHYSAGTRVYAFSSVFAPVDFEIAIVHRWDYWDEQERAWIPSSVISFPAVGGRDGGYRGFSFKEAVFPGLWRVSVETEQGALIGRVRFDIVSAPEPPELILELK